MSHSKSTDREEQEIARYRMPRCSLVIKQKLTGSYSFEKGLLKKSK